MAPCVTWTLFAPRPSSIPHSHPTRSRTLTAGDDGVIKEGAYPKENNDAVGFKSVLVRALDEAYNRRKGDNEALRILIHSYVCVQVSCLGSTLGLSRSFDSLSWSFHGLSRSFHDLYRSFHDLSRFGALCQ